MRVLQKEIRRTAFRWGPPGFIGLMVFGALSMLRTDVPMWGDITAGIAASGIFVNPIVAGLAAWEAGWRGRPLRARSLGSARALGAGTIVQLSAMMCWLALSYVLAFVIVCVEMAGRGGAYGVANRWWLASAVSGSLLALVGGYCAGLGLRGRWFAGPLATVLMYLGFAAVSGTGLPYWVTQAYPDTLNSTNPFVVYILTTFVSQIAWYLGITAILMAVLAWGRRPARWPRPSLIAVVVLAIVPGAGLAGLISTNGEITRGHNSRDYRCGVHPLPICVNTAYAKGIPALEKAFHDFNGRVAGTQLVATRLEHNVQGVGDRVSPGARDLYLEDLGPGFAESAVEDYEQTYGGLEKCTSPGSTVAHEIVDSWTVGLPLPDVGVPSAVMDTPGSFWRLASAGRTQWLVAHESEFRSCTLTIADLQ